MLKAVALALVLAAIRLVADVTIPPHMQWWFTPLIALQTSLVTSVYWLCWHRSPRKALGGAR
jgi:hypothetical protein